MTHQYHLAINFWCHCLLLLWGQFVTANENGLLCWFVFVFFDFFGYGSNQSCWNFWRKFKSNRRKKIVTQEISIIYTHIYIDKLVMLGGEGTDRIAVTRNNSHWPLGLSHSCHIMRILLSNPVSWYSSDREVAGGHNTNGLLWSQCLSCLAVCDCA